MRSRRVLLDRRPARERAFPERLQQRLPFLAVEVAHAVHMPLEGARIDEFRQRELFEARYRARIESLLVAVGIHQFGRKHHVADAQRRHHRLRKRVEVDDAIAPVLGEKRERQPPCIAELAVVVVFDDVAAGFLIGPAQHVRTRRGGHHASRGEAIRGRNVHEPRIGSAQAIHIEVVAYVEEVVGRFRGHDDGARMEF